MTKKKQGFAVTGSDDAATKGKSGGKKGGAVKTKKGFAVTGDPRAMAKRSWVVRREKAAAAQAAAAASK